jgi:hypothetical protein
MADHLTWVYAVVSGLDPQALDGVTGVSAEQVRTVGTGPAAVVGYVSGETFSGEALERRLSEPEELAPVVRAHHHVIQALAAVCTTLPVRLATVYRNDDGVRDLLADRADVFATTLRWLDGRTEYGVKVWAGRDPGRDNGARTAAGSPGDPVPAGVGAGATGTSYLQRRRADLAAQEAGWQRDAELSNDLHAALSAHAVAALRHRTHGAQAAGRPGRMVLNGAYLIDRAAVADFPAAAEAAVSGYDTGGLEVTGPWPPYSFAEGPRQ